MIARLLAVVLTVATAAAGAACGPGAGAAPRGPATPAERVPHAAWERVRGLKSVDGLALDQMIVPGRASVFIVFATWCEYCREELAMLGELRARYPDVQIIGLNAYETWGERSDAERMHAYLAEHAPWLTVAEADDALLADLGGVPKIPSLFVFDGRGALVQAFRRHEIAHPPTEDELVRALSAAGVEPVAPPAPAPAAAGAR